MPAPEKAAPYVAAAQHLAPRIASARSALERERSLPAELAIELVRGGFCALWRCEALGGPELDFPSYLSVIEELSRLDGSVGWCATVASVWSRLSGFVTADTASEVFAGDNLWAGSVNPTGRAVAVPGGYRVSGRWSYGSFIGHSRWTIGNAIVHDGDAPRHDANGAPEFRFMIMPTEAVEIIDNWHVAGLRGTGSCDFTADDVFVPEERSLLAFGPQPVQSGALYRMPQITTFAASLPCVSLGIARAAIDAFIQLAEGKTPMGSRALLRDKPLAQADLGRAEALVRSGRAFLLEAMGDIWNTAAADETPSLRQRAVARLAIAQAAQASAQAVDLLFNAAGGSALFESTPLERCFRDVHATTQHIGTNTANFELGGRVLLGLDPGTPRF